MFSRWKRDLTPVQDPYGPNAHPFDQDETRNIPAVMVTGPWHPKMQGYLVDKDVRGLYLNSAKGFRCDDYGFLREMPQLELLSILAPSAAALDGPMPISRLTRLKHLTANFALKEPVDFANLTDLRSCVLKWNARLNTLFEALSLERLHLYSLKDDLTAQLGGLKQLSNLQLSFAGIRTLTDLVPLENLNMLVLEVCRNLESLEGVDAFRNLKCLRLAETHKISSLEWLRPLKKLEVLTIADCGELASLAPLADLPNLKAVSFAGAKTTIVDGDLSPLTRLPKLSMLMFGARRHYSHRLTKKWDWGNFDTADQLLVPK